MTDSDHEQTPYSAHHSSRTAGMALQSGRSKGKFCISTQKKKDTDNVSSIKVTTTPGAMEHGQTYRPKVTANDAGNLVNSNAPANDWPRAIIRQRKAQRPVRFEITARTRKSVQQLIEVANLSNGAYLFPSRVHQSPRLSTRQYARIVETWVTSIGLDSTAYGTHSLRRTKATIIYRRTKNLRAVQLLLGHSKLDSTVRYLGIEINDALEISEQIDV